MLLAEICLLILLFFSISSKSFSASNHRAKKKKGGGHRGRLEGSHFFVYTNSARCSPCSLLLLNSVLTAVKATVRSCRNLCITRYWHQTGRINIVNEVWTLWEHVRRSSCRISGGGGMKQGLRGHKGVIISPMSGRMSKFRRLYKMLLVCFLLWEILLFLLCRNNCCIDQGLF